MVRRGAPGHMAPSQAGTGGRTTVSVALGQALSRTTNEVRA